MLVLDDLLALAGRRVYDLPLNGPTLLVNNDLLLTGILCWSLRLLRGLNGR